MTAKPALHIVPTEPSGPSVEDTLRSLLADRDKAAEALRQIDAMIAEQGRAWVRAKGEFMAPTVERLRRELGG